jgi:phosphoglycolate phosphatase-like HAD superfamily hydrolase
MKPNFSFLILLLLLVLGSCKKVEPADPTGSGISENKDALPSWNETVPKTAIFDFVAKTTDPNSPDFIPESKRIAAFDNDGTLWSEQPFYFQLVYALDFVKKNWEKNPEWAKDPLLQAAKNDDLSGIVERGEKGLLELVMKTHTGMSAAEFAQNVKDWLDTAKHPASGKNYRDMVYQPMLELLDFLRSNGFKTFIVSGGGIDFLRVWAEEVYGIPPYQIVGSSVKATYTEGQGEKTIVKLPELNFIDDGPGKPVGIHQHIGQIPVIAVGNSDGDFEMLEYTTEQPGPRLGLLIHHTDSVREYAYDSLSHIGRLRKGLVEAPSRGWVVVDMAKDWKTIYPKPKDQ